MIAFAHIALNCGDMARTERFYSTYFGFRRARVVPVGEGKSIIFLKTDTVYLELFDALGERTTPPPQKDGDVGPGLRHIAFRVPHVDQLIADMGTDTRVMLGPASFDDVIPGWRSAWISDPDGNILEISQGYTDQAQPPPPPWGDPAR
jgi:glyoxylase I family protein